MKKTTIILTCVFLVASIFMIYFLKHEVKMQEKKIAQLHKKIAAEKSSIQLLKVEWAYLNEPERLKKLNAKYLKLLHLDKNQIAKPQNASDLILARNNNEQWQKLAKY